MDEKMGNEYTEISDGSKGGVMIELTMSDRIAFTDRIFARCCHLPGAFHITYLPGLVSWATVRWCPNSIYLRPSSPFLMSLPSVSFVCTQKYANFAQEKATQLKLSQPELKLLLYVGLTRKYYIDPEHTHGRLVRWPNLMALITSS
jgi:hypothetical protein